MREQYQAALATGGDIVIPTGEFLAAFSQSPLLDYLLEQVRVNGNEMSLAEVRQWIDEGGAEQLRTETEQRVLAVREESQARDNIKPIHEHIDKAIDDIQEMLKKSEMASLATGLTRPSRDEAEAAVRTLIRWAGDNPDREGLVGTPDRVVRAYEEFFAGYDEDPREMLQRTFEEVEGYDEVVMLRDIRLESHCEHHMVPIIGKVHIGYLPDKRVVGISKLARVVDAYARRLQIQEKLTAQIANCLQEVLQPRGVAVVIEAAHQCMTTRGVHKSDVAMVTSRMLGAFRDNGETRREFLTMIGRSSG